jgi:hypothetical protein
VRDCQTTGHERASHVNDRPSYPTRSAHGALAWPSLDEGTDEVAALVRVHRLDDHAVVLAGLASVDPEIVPERIGDHEAAVLAELRPAREDPGDLLQAREPPTAERVTELGVERGDEVLVEEGEERLPCEVGVGTGVVGRVLQHVDLE